MSVLDGEVIKWVKLTAEEARRHRLRAMSPSDAQLAVDEDEETAMRLSPSRKRAHFGADARARRYEENLKRRKYRRLGEGSSNNNCDEEDSGEVKEEPGYKAAKREKGYTSDWGEWLMTWNPP